MPIIAPSLLAANFLHLEKEVQMVNDSVAKWLHLDVMDGRFVPNISFGVPVIQQVTKISKKVNDVHLMIWEPEKYVDIFHKAGANNITVHYEACPHLHRNIDQIKSLGMKAGVALNPHTPVALLHDILHDVDMVCIMSVNPGFGGQRFIEHTYTKIRELKNIIKEKGYDVLIEVDGGVTVDNAAALFDAGADVLVAGNTVFSAKNPKETIQVLLNAK